MTAWAALGLQSASILDERSLIPLGTAGSVLVVMFFGYKWLRDQFDRLRDARNGDVAEASRERDKDRAAWNDAVAALCRRLEAVERNQRTRWSLEHQRIFELELARANADKGLAVPDCYRIAQRLPQDGDEG